MRRLGKQISALVTPTQKVMASQEDAYLSHLGSMLSGRTVRPVGQVAVADLRAGVAPEDVYQRLAVQFRYERSTGTDEPKALEHALTRADVMNQMDVALAARAQDQKALTVMQVAVGYRRVIHPELSKGGACGLCIVASDRRYKKSDLMPLHARCRCSVTMILRGGVDPGGSLNNLDLGDLYEAAGSTKAADLKRTRYTVQDNGELGPVLAPKGTTDRLAS